MPTADVYFSGPSTVSGLDVMCRGLSCRQVCIDDSWSMIVRLSHTVIHFSSAPHQTLTRCLSISGKESTSISISESPGPDSPSTSKGQRVGQIPMGRRRAIGWKVDYETHVRFSLSSRIKIYSLSLHGALNLQLASHFTMPASSSCSPSTRAFGHRKLILKSVSAHTRSARFSFSYFTDLKKKSSVLHQQIFLSNKIPFSFA